MKIETLLAAATERPWNHYDDSNDGKTNRHEIVAIGKTVAHIYCSVPIQDAANAELIMRLANSADALVSLVKAAREAINNHDTSPAQIKLCEALAALSPEWRE